MFDTPFDRNYDEPVADRRDTSLPANPEDGAVGQQGVTRQQPRRPRVMRTLMAGLLVLALVAAWWTLGGQSQAPATPPVPTVTVAQPLQREIAEWDEFVGRFEASQSVEVRPQVTGQITAIHFVDGQFVRQGAPLFTIDPRSYRAALAEAQAEAGQAESRLALSLANLARAERLVEDDAVSAIEIDRLRAEVRNDRASLAAARARVASRSLEVGFTTVRAPISGHISDRRVDAGNLVSGSGGSTATLLTTINAVDPVYFEFTGSEALFLKARREGLDKGAPVEIRLQDEAEYRWRGTLDFTDNGLDSQSGTIRARAVVRNAEGTLAPGLFGQMRLASGGTRKALLVPDTAIATDQTRKLVLVVGQDGTIIAKPVELGPLVGSLRVIESGIGRTDRVIITGTQMAMPGQKVDAKPGRVAEPQRAASSPPPSRARASHASIAG